MAFAPESLIYLCNVPFDNSYKHVVYFDDKVKQLTYFNNKVVKIFSNYLVVRKTLPSGGLRSSLKVEMNIDALRELPCNYLMFNNVNHGKNRWYYCFITEFIYINEETTEIVFETDVYQTWFLECSMKRSFVVREHSVTDEIGDNIVPEKFEFGEYVYSSLGDALPESSYKWSYLITATHNDNVDQSGFEHSGIYQGLYFYYVSGSNLKLGWAIDSLAHEQEDCIVSITCLPDFCIQSDRLVKCTGDKGDLYEMYWLKPSDNPAITHKSIDMSSYSFTFEGYKPTNNKLFTSPFMKIEATNGNGSTMEYTIEDFSNRNDIQFRIFGDISPNPGVYVVPISYKGVGENVDFGIRFADFPQCSYNTDTYKLWLNKNFVPNLIKSAASIAGAVVMGSASGGPIGGAMATAAAVGTIGNMIAEDMTKRKEPDKGSAGNPSTNLLTAMKRNNVRFLCKRIKKVYAQTIDDYFTMFGYQTNRVKVPNLSSRPFFNFVQTVGCNIIGTIPNDDLLRLKQIFDGGVTLWKPTATVGDYSVDNRP